MAFKAAGNAISVLREHVSVNAASFSGTLSNPTAMADFFPNLARIDGEPARQTKTHDSTDYSGNSLEDSWEFRLFGISGANASRLSSATEIRGGLLT
jgi:hypothetical protein